VKTRSRWTIFEFFGETQGYGGDSQRHEYSNLFKFEPISGDRCHFLELLVFENLKEEDNKKTRENDEKLERQEEEEEREINRIKR
jgi:hypothetical protein